MLEACLGEIAEIDVDQLRQRRLVPRLRPDEREEFEQRLSDLLDELQARLGEEGIEAFATYVATHPSR